ncbi:hypothetical protein OQA88_2130 [Cercophora sp. LCS_1]
MDRSGVGGDNPQSARRRGIKRSATIPPSEGMEPQVGSETTNQAPDGGSPARRRCLNDNPEDTMVNARIGYSSSGIQASVHDAVWATNWGYDQDWTHDDEIKFQQDLKDCSIWASSNDYYDPEISELRKLVQFCCEFWACSPFSIISPAFGLEFKGETEDDDGVVRDARWTLGFCIALHRLVSHPFFNRNKELLALCIQYTVIQRTGRGKLWSPTFNNLRDKLDEEFLRAMFSFPEEDPKYNSQLARREAATREVVIGRLGEPPLSQLFRHIERVIAEKEEKPTWEEPGLFRVTDGDLLVLREALDRMQEMGISVFKKTKAYYEDAIEKQLSVDLHYCEVDRHSALAVAAEFRKVKRAEKAAGSSDGLLRTLGPDERRTKEASAMKNSLFAEIFGFPPLNQGGSGGNSK